MNYSEVVLPSLGPDRADKSSRCSGRVCPCHGKRFSLPRLLSPYILFTATPWETSTKIYELKLELSISLPTPSSFPCRPSLWLRLNEVWTFQTPQKSRQVTARTPVCLPLMGQTPCWRKKKRNLWKEKHKNYRTPSQMVNSLSKSFPEMMKSKYHSFIISSYFLWLISLVSWPQKHLWYCIRHEYIKKTDPLRYLTWGAGGFTDSHIYDPVLHENI